MSSLDGPAQRAAEAPDGLLSQFARTQDPDQRRRLVDAKAQENLRSYLEAADGLRRDLHDAGFDVIEIAELCEEGIGDPRALPILLDWLPRVSDKWVKLDVIATLACRWARPGSAAALIAEYRRIDPATDPRPTLGIRMAIGDAIERIADESVIEDLIAIATDRSQGPHRSFIVAALGKMRRSRERVIPILVDLLDDETVTAYALIGLRKLHATETRARVVPLLAHPNDWVREQAKKTLARFDR